MSPLVAQPALPFEVVLACAPGAGYTWELSALPEGLTLLASDFKHAANARPGDAASQCFRLCAQHTGDFRLQFVLKRRWETDGIDSQDVAVVVR